jgi:hypothetical protein
MGAGVPPPQLKMDNHSVIALSKTAVLLHDCSKHVHMKFHFLRECVDGGRCA